ncbi:MAG: hypothetical protein ABGX16_00235 [Pirellulales bacterium]
MKFYDRLALASGENFQLSEASTKALGRLGDIHRQLGHRQQSLDRYANAQTKLQRLMIDHPQHMRLAVESARIHNEMGRVYFVDGNYPEAQHSHQQALDILDDANATNNEAMGLYEQACTHYYLGRRLQVSASRVAME